jgi:hypothetical protein
MARCPHCRQTYERKRMGQKSCESVPCAIAAGQARKAKESAKKAKAERAEIRVRKEALRPLQYWLKRAQKAVNEYCRARDLKAGYGCITCGTHDAEEWHAGHWISVGASSATRFDPANIHLQCRKDNYFGGGMAQEYEARLPARIGQAEVDRLKNSSRNRKWTREECQSIEAEFKEKLKSLNRDTLVIM